MSKVRSLLLSAVLAAGAFGSFGAHAAPQKGCTSSQDKGARTAAGSHKDGKTNNDCNGDIHCGSGEVVAVPLGDGTEIKLFVSPTASTGPEVEACNDSGTGTTQGRAVVRVNPADRGVRASLDTDDETPQFPGGYINAQVGEEGTGVWCNKETETTSDGKSNLDGYEQPWDKPGSDGGANEKALGCIPTQ